MNVLAGGPNVTVSRVIGKSKEKIGKSSGGRAKGGRSRQFCESLASQRRRLVNILAEVPRVADRHSFASHWRVKGDLRMFWRECQGWQIRESLASQRRRLANVLAGGPRVADQDSSASHWRVKGEDWRMFWRECQGWQSKTVGGSIRPLTGGGCAAPLWRLR